MRAVTHIEQNVSLQIHVHKSVLACQHVVKKREKERECAINALYLRIAYVSVTEMLCDMCLQEADVFVQIFS